MNNDEFITFYKVVLTLKTLIYGGTNRMKPLVTEFVT
jgi:hypothetical protein